MTSAPGPQASVESPERENIPSPSKLSYIPYQRKKTPARRGTPITARTISNPSPTKPRELSGNPSLGYRSSSAQIVKPGISPLITIASSPTNSDSSGVASPTKVNERSLHSPQLPASISPPPLRRIISHSESQPPWEGKESDLQRRTLPSPSGSPLKQQLTDGSFRTPSPLKTQAHPHSYASVIANQDEFHERSSFKSTVTTSSTDTARRAPYRSGFQPKGVVRHRTDEFMALREKRRGVIELDDQRMERRLEKLLVIYSPGFEHASGINTSVPSSSWMGRGSFVLDVLYSKQEQEKHRLQQLRRLAEQDVVKWQDDKNYTNCALCATPFSLAVRRHHCRLCGQVVCSSPHLPSFLRVSDDANRMEAWEPCSSLMVPVNSYKRLRDMPPRPGPHSSLAEQQSYEFAELNSIRVCRVCKHTVYRIQFGRNSIQLTPLDPLYQNLLSLEGEIAEALPDYHEMLLGLKYVDSHLTSRNMDMKDSSENRALQADTMHARKELLARFTCYDQLAKQIMGLPPLVDGLRCPTQKRLQEAILARANMFLRKHVRYISTHDQTFPIESLPSVTGKASKNDRDHCTHSDAQEQLRILHEQDALLNQYLDAARKARNLDDVASLQRNQEEIRQEIVRVQQRISVS